MHDIDKLARISNALITQYGEAGKIAAANLRKWLSGDVAYAMPDMIERHLDGAPAPLIFDAFRQVVPFGTGGQRGPVGYGPNRINPANLAITVQGHCNYLRATYAGKDLAVVVAADVRTFKDFSGRYGFLGQTHPLIGLSSRKLGQLACEIYAANGIKAYFPPPEMYDGTASTPEMSFQIRRLGTVGGIQLSASHNPPDDNGLKIYNEFGSQPIAPEDERLGGFIETVDGIDAIAFDEGCKRGLIQFTDRDTHDAYIKVYTDMYGSMPKPDRDMPIVYAPLNGCGLSSVGDLLDRLGFNVAIPPGEGPDGSFSAVPLRAPNPEVPQATRNALDYADSIGSGIVLSSDPDVDRVGLDVKLASGDWHHFDGNQIASVLARFLMLDPRGPRRKGLVIETFVTTRLLGEIAKAAGAQVIDDLPVGMKYVANVLNELETHGRYGNVELSPNDLAFAAEESHGIILAPFIRDKDAAPACMYLACLYQILRREGRTILDYYVETLAQLGAHETVNRSIVMSGPDGARDKDAIMEVLRRDPPQSVAGARVQRVVDFWDQEQFGPFKGYTDELSRNAIQFFTEKFTVTIRPSGTEPKLKIYCQLLPPDGRLAADAVEALRELKDAANEVASRSYNETLALVGHKLGASALLLPDIIDVSQKIQFEKEILPALARKASAAAGATLEETLAWLRSEAAAMTPGADPLPALKDAIAHFLAQASAGAPARLTAELLGWASGEDDKPRKKRRRKGAKSKPEGTQFLVVSANCAAAARAVRPTDGEIADRAQALGAYILDKRARKVIPVVAGLQELGRFDAPTPNRPPYASLLGLPRKSGGFYFVPTLSTGRYPLQAKWRVRWENDICHAEQGVAAVALRGAALHDPEANEPPACGTTTFQGAVIDLPVVKFRKPSDRAEGAPDEDWFRHKTSFGGRDYEVEFRHSRYLGDRDTEPRLATAHRVRLQTPHAYAPEFVFINLHLTTLRERPGAAGADQSRALRSRSPDAEFLRHLQLNEVNDFIWRIYREDKLPVVVAGDFNTAPDRPDLADFMERACLQPVFRSDRCWACGSAPLSAAKPVYGSEGHQTVLTTEPSSFERITGEAPTEIAATEYCSKCARPLFTHKRNFQLVDNILYTSGEPPGAPLRARVAFDVPEQNAGVGADTYFSDHFPIWAMFRLIQNDAPSG